MSKTTLTRRSFVKASALTGAAVAIGASMAGCMKETEQQEAPAEETDDGLVKMRTSCHGCIQVCPAIAYLKDGVVVKLEGDKEAPVSRGSLCIKGLNELHTMYSPRRVLHPLRRAGERGENKWEVISWDEAIEEAATHIHDAIEKYGNYSFFASVGGGGSYSFMNAMTIPHAFGSPTVFEPGCAQCYLPRWSLSKLFYGGDDQSVADNAVQEIFRVNDNKTELVVVWGAQPSVSETAESGRAMAELRAQGVKTIVVDPNFSPDAMKADVWLPVRPGTDTGVLLSWFRYIFENKAYDEQFTKYWTNLPFLIDPDTKLPVLASELFPEFQQTTPDNTPAYVCYDLKTNAVAPFEFSAPEDATVDPEIFWSGDFDGKTYKTAGQIYKEQADPWTFEHTEEVCWVPADRNEAAVKMYIENWGGIVNGVASDMTESASQVPLGCMGLDSIMGRINKPGVTMTQKGLASVPTARPVTYNNGFAGMFSDMYGIGAVIGMSEAENEARIKQLGEAMPDSQRIHNQLLVDRLGMKEHKGLYAWCHSHIPTVREAIATGEPYKPRVWFDMSGNKLAMLGNAKSWYDVFPEVDYVICQYPMLTSFQVEAADLVFPVREWLEEPMINMTQLNTQWLQNECVHIGETVSHTIPGAQVVARVREMFGGEIPNGLMPGYMGESTEQEVKDGLVASFGAKDWDDLRNNSFDYSPIVTPEEDYFQYNQHEVVVDDNLPAGFATESRKVEVYCQMLLKMARTGYPFCYPEPQEACEDYSPICEFIEPAESPYQNSGDEDQYPLILTSGRVPYFHHGTMRHAPFSRALHPTAEIRINPVAAAERGIEHMDWVKVTSRRGEVHARAYLTEGVAPGTVWMERFWNPECFDASQSAENYSAGWRECNVNVLTKNSAPFNEVYGSYTNRGFTVQVEKSEKPANVWVEPEEFAPFMPTEEMLAEAQTGDVF